MSNHYIVAVGASAGGLEAIHEFFDHMPESTNLSFVLIQHLSPDYKSLLVELVSRHTHMKVFEAENNLQVKKNCIYVIPNNKLITIRNNKLQLEEKKINPSPNNAIDVFLYALAEEKKEKSIAVILSGTGTDGTRGIETIKRAGGIVMVQEPATARFDGMPNSAIQSGNVDFILPPASMPAEIFNHIQNPHSEQHAQFEMEENKLDEIFNLVHKAAGQGFHYYKTPTILRRIHRRMTQLNIKTIEEYIELLRKSNDECKLLAKDFLIGVTRFFRDREAFNILENDVIAKIVAGKKENETIKVWISACSTGEEAYSVAILFNEAIEKQNKNIDLKIFATDMDEANIEIAAKGIYSGGIENDIDSALLSKYFVKKNKSYTIVQNIRKQIVFARHNIIKDPPFIKNDLVTCRNMLIYMNNVLQQKIFAVLLFAVNKEGYLFLGSSENPNFIKDSVEEISAKWKIYRKITETRISSQYLSSMEDRNVTAFERNYKTAAKTASKQTGLWDECKEILNEDLNLAAFYIDRNFDIREALGNYARFLSLPKKILNLNFLRMLPKDICFSISSEVKKAWKENTKSVIKNLRYRKDNQLVALQVVVKPLQPYTLIVISETEAIDMDVSEPVTALQTEANSDYLLSLEAELTEVKNHLQMAVEDLETTNEELQSSNEELLSANEELQSSNEELQSLNEELHTLNTEHQLKIKELIEVNDDLNNYFRSTDIGQVFLDKNLRIRKFNSASARMINFIDADIGRPISHISNNIRYDYFLSDVEQVLQQNIVIEKEVQLLNNRNMLMRILPYLTRDRESNGVIITFVDITTITNLNNIIRGVFNSSKSAIFSLRSVRDNNNNITDFTLQAANHAAGALLENSVEENIGKGIKKLIPQLLSNDLFAQFVKVVQQDTFFNSDISIGTQWLEITAVKMMDGLVATFTDITEKKIAEQKLRKNYAELITAKDNLKKANDELESKVLERTKALSASEERFRLVARATNDALWDWDMVNNKMWFGDTFYKQFGYDKEAGIAGRHFLMDKVHPEDRALVNEAIQSSMNSHQSQWNIEYRFLKKDGTYAHILERGYILQDEFGTPYRMLGSMFDVTELKDARQELLENVALRKFMAESMPLIVWTADSHGHVDFVNQYFETYTGAEYKEALGDQWQKFVHHEDLYRLRPLWQFAVRNKTDFQLEIRLKKKNESHHWNLMRAKANLDEEGKLVKFIITVTDIHEQKVMNEVLENKVKERTKELKDINNALEISNNDLQQFASVASHDLQEPLRKIQMFSKLIKDQHLDELQNGAAIYLDKIMSSSARMKSLITDVLNYSKLSGDNSAFQVTNMEKLVGDIVDDFEVTIAEKNATVQISSIPKLEVIPGQMRQVFHNLLSNALKFNKPEVPPAITIEATLVDEKSFTAHAFTDGMYCRISFKDNGIGFDEHYAEDIFNLFQRLHSKDSFEGTGIGLSITKRIIEKHNGLITAKSKEGEGTEFIIVLPVQRMIPV